MYGIKVNFYLDKNKNEMESCFFYKYTAKANHDQLSFF